VVSANLNVVVLEVGSFIELLLFPVLFPKARAVLRPPTQKNLGDLITDETDRFVFRRLHGSSYSTAQIFKGKEKLSLGR